MIRYNLYQLLFVFFPLYLFPSFSASIFEDQSSKTFRKCMKLLNWLRPTLWVRICIVLEEYLNRIGLSCFYPQLRSNKSNRSTWVRLKWEIVGLCKLVFWMALKCSSRGNKQYTTYKKRGKELYYHCKEDHSLVNLLLVRIFCTNKVQFHPNLAL